MKMGGWVGGEGMWKEQTVSTMDKYFSRRNNSNRKQPRDHPTAPDLAFLLCLGLCPGLGLHTPLDRALADPLLERVELLGEGLHVLRLGVLQPAHVGL